VRASINSRSGKEKFKNFNHFYAFPTVYRNNEVGYGVKKVVIQ